MVFFGGIFHIAHDGFLVFVVVAVLLKTEFLFPHEAMRLLQLLFDPNNRKRIWRKYRINSFSLNYQSLFNRAYLGWLIQ